MIIFLSLVAGCARMTPKTKYWINQNITDMEQVRKDVRECVYEGRKMKLTVEGSGRGIQGYNDGNYAQMVTVHNCMESKGYYLSDTIPGSK